MASLSGIGPGETLTFSVPKDHLDPGLAVRVDFTFRWQENDRYTRFSCYFSYCDLPGRLRDRQKEKKLKQLGIFRLESPELPELPEPAELPALGPPFPDLKLPSVLLPDRGREPRR